MPEGVPPPPTSNPPKPVPVPKEEKEPTVIDSSAWGASDIEPGAAAAASIDDLKKGARGVAGKVSDAIKAARKPKSLRPHVHMLTGHEPELELPAPDAELALEAPHATSGTYAGHDGDFPVEIGETKIGPDGQPYVHVHSSEQNLDGFVPAASVTKEKVPASTMVPGASGLISLESLQNPDKKDFIKPAEIKRIWKEELKNAVGKVALTQENLSSPEALAKPSFADYVSGMREMAKQSRANALGTYQTLQVADTKYEETFKNFYKNNNFVGRIFKRMRPLGAASLELNDARNERDELRLSANNELAAAARERWEAQGKSKEWIDKAFARYQNWYLLRDIITPGAERETQMRAEALGEKVPDQLEKGMAWVKRTNDGVNTWIEEKLGEKNKKLVPYARALGSAVIISGGVSLAASLGTVGVMAGLGIAGFSITRALIAAGVGAGAAELVGAGYKKLIGEKAQAKAKIENVDLREELKRLTQNKELTLELLQTIDRKRVQLQSRASDETLNQKTVLLKTLVGLGVGMGTAAAITNWDNIGNVVRASEHAGAGSAPTGPSGAESGPMGPSGGDVPDGGGMSSPEASSGDASGAPSTPEASVSSGEAMPEAPSLSISGNINNADTLVGHFGLELQESFPNSADAPPAVQKLYEILHVDNATSLLAGEDQATLALGLQLPDGTSAIMQPGDTIGFVDNQIVLERPGVPEFRTVLIDANGELATAHNFPMETSVETSSASVTPEVAPQPDIAAASEAPSIVEAPTAPLASEAVPQPLEVPQQPAESPAYVPDVPSAPEIPPAPEAPVAPEAPRAPEPPVTFDTAPEVPAAPEAPTAPVAPEAPPAPEATPGVVVNEYGLQVDSRVAEVYADASDNIIVHGGTLIERMQLAQEFIARDHSAVVFLDSTMPDPITGLDVAHITRAFWDPTLNQIQMPNEAMDPSLQSYSLPTADDLARRVDMPQ